MCTPYLDDASKSARSCRKRARVHTTRTQHAKFNHLSAFLTCRPEVRDLSCTFARFWYIVSVLTYCIYSDSTIQLILLHTSLSVGLNLHNFNGFKCCLKFRFSKMSRYLEPGKIVTGVWSSDLDIKGGQDVRIHISFVVMNSQHPQLPTSVGTSSNPSLHDPTSYYPYAFSQSHAHPGHMNPPYYTYPVHPSFAPPHNPYHTFTAAPATSTANQLHPPSGSGSTSGYRAPLSDTTTSTVNNVAPANGSRQNTSKKRKRNNPASGTTKKPSSTSTSLVRPAIPGVGPQTAAMDTPAMIHPALPPCRRDPVNFESLLPKSTNAPGYAATDVWYFVRGIEAAEKPLIAPSNKAVSKQQPDCTKYPSLLCRFCG